MKAGMETDWEAPASILAFMIGAAAVIAVITWYFARSGESSVECTKAGGEWHADACRKVEK